MSFLSLKTGLTIQLILLLLAYSTFSPVNVFELVDGTLPSELARAADLYKENLPHSAMLSTEYMWVGLSDGSSNMQPEPISPTH